MRKTIVIGIDGATWNEIRPLISELPNFEYLIRHGASGAMRTIDPAYTPILWATISTGKRPESNGIARAQPIQTRYWLRSLTIWDIVEDDGKRIGLFNWPVTWPARGLNGFVIPDPPLSDETFPPQLQFVTKMRGVGRRDRGLSFRRRLVQQMELLTKGTKHGLTLTTLAGVVAYLLRAQLLSDRDILEIERALLGQGIFTDLFCRLCKEFDPDLSLLYLEAVDVAAHIGWKYHEPQKFPTAHTSRYGRHRQYVRRSYLNTDRCIGKILRMSHGEASIIVLSDHGTKSATDGDPALDIKADLLFERVGIKDNTDHLFCDNKTYFSLRNGDTEGTTNRIQQACIAESGQQLFRVVDSDIPGIYCIKCEDALARIVNEDAEWKSVKVKLGSSQAELAEVVGDRYRVSGIHDKYGIFIACGEGVRADTWIGDVELTDVVPTVLHYFGMPVGADMEGKILTGMFDEDFVSNNPVEYVRTYDTDERLDRYSVIRGSSREQLCSIEGRLKMLGLL